MYAGMKIISDPNCLKDTAERLFPKSRHRSARIHKKLVKRHGGEFRRVPAIFKIGDDTLIAHPVMYARIQAETRQGGATHTVSGPAVAKLEREAADEIERLRERLKDAQSEIKDLRYNRGDDWASMAADVR